MMRKGAEYTLRLTFDILRILKALEDMNREVSTQELAKILDKDYGVILRHRNVLEKLGLVKIEPIGVKNIVKLTDKGRCLARCVSEA